MTIRMLPALLLGTLFLCIPCRAQDTPAGRPEVLPEPQADGGAPCQSSQQTKTTYKIEWFTRESPRTVEKWSLKGEDAGQEVRDGLEIEWREETRVRTETTLRPREVAKEVTVCTTQAIEQIDPATGCKNIVMVPKTETKIVKEIVYETQTNEQTYIVKIPCLKHVDKVFDLKRLRLDRSVETVNEKYGILVPTEVTERVLVPAKPCCEKQ